MNDSDPHIGTKGNPRATACDEAPGALMFALLHTAGTVQQRMEQAFEAVGLSSAKFGVLSQLAEAGAPLSLSELAARLSCVRSNMTQLVDRLEADNLVRRVDDPTDRRIVRAELTPLGQERAHAGARQLADVLATFTATLSPADREALRRILDGLG
jgi:DNA-binding MarR family transcriptional regulator